ncbi:CesT family type III secretion system chaperone [Pseudomonas chlororaphis subsp. aurantiaca]|uniref:CesT family type III secretion system chaperone n=1 Tax=Pseudomonas chlororaphis TaxID=587753 RepID=UPI0027DCD896|nr:CesT family type III secretion system chaperone [Pseudomonas chlororaphis]WMI97531.1 CesT family type III secretion system chaperone [Pseudomonas chlororaphis subsp. aurantiaca]
MTSQYQTLIKELYLSLSLPEPTIIESVTSLQLDSHVCHLTEHPADYMLMFVSVEPSGHALVDEQNLFSQDPCKPVLGLDPVGQGKVLWNRQHLMQMDRAMVHHQLEQLVSVASELTQPG